MKEGITYIYRTKEILGALCLDMFAVLFWRSSCHDSCFRKWYFKSRSWWFLDFSTLHQILALWWLFNAFFYSIKKKSGQNFNRCSSWIWFMHHWFRFVKTLLVIASYSSCWAGIFDGISVVIRGTIVQLKTPDHIRGRVMSANSIFIMS